MSWKYEAKQNKERIGPILVSVISNGKTETLKNYGKHSPDGFQIGYAGSGPSDLAYSILIDYFIKLEGTTWSIDFMKLKYKIESFYQQFKNDFIVREKDFLQIDSETIELWLEKKRYY